MVPHGTRHEVAIRETNLFRRENGEWKMIGHHSDLLPFIGPPVIAHRSARPAAPGAMA